MPRRDDGAGAVPERAWGNDRDNFLSARGADDLGLTSLVNPMQIQWEVGENPTESTGRGGRAASLTPSELALKQPWNERSSLASTRAVTSLMHHPV